MRRMLEGKPGSLRPSTYPQWVYSQQLFYKTKFDRFYCRPISSILGEHRMGETDLAEGWGRIRRGGGSWRTLRWMLRMRNLPRQESVEQTLSGWKVLVCSVKDASGVLAGVWCACRGAKEDDVGKMAWGLVRKVLELFFVFFLRFYLFIYYFVCVGSLSLHTGFL